MSPARGDQATPAPAPTTPVRTPRSTVLAPAHPERICWGCDRRCPADDLACGNGTIRCPHPIELFGDDWLATAIPLQVLPSTDASDDEDD